MNEETLKAVLADPYSIQDTSGGDPRIHAVRRIALAALALGKSPKIVEQDALFMLGYPKRKGIPIRYAHELTVKQLEKVATAYEEYVDFKMYA